MTEEMVCIVCPMGCRLQIDENLNVTGNTCPRGAVYAKAEKTHPVRTVTTTVEIEGALYRRLPVITSAPIDKDKMFDLMEALKDITVKAPVNEGDVILANALGTGVDIISSRTMKKTVES